MNTINNRGGYMDELETLNMLLRTIGSSPVNSLETDHPDAANALATMERTSQRLQRKGWWCNIEYSIIVTPNERGEILFDKRVSSVVAECRSYVKRGNRLYDKVNQTATFNQSVRLNRLIRILDWDDMPPVMQEACAYQAAAEFVRDELEDPSKEQSLQQTGAATFLDLKKQELEEGQYNIFDKRRFIQARGGIQPYSRGSRRFAGDPDA